MEQRALPAVLAAAMALTVGLTSYALNQVLPIGTIVSQSGAKVTENTWTASETTAAVVNWSKDFGGIFVPESQFGSYQLWMDNSDKVYNDKRIEEFYEEYGSNAMGALIASYYPELDPEWEELIIDSEDFSINLEYGWNGHNGTCGTVQWIENDTAVLSGMAVYNEVLKVIDANTIEVFGERYIKVRDW